MLEPIDESGISATGSPRTPLRTPERWQNMARRTNGRAAKEPVTPMSGDQRPPPPSQILSLIKEPSLANYSAVRSCLRRGDHIWMEEFLAKDGLILLLTGLEEMSLQIKKLEDVMVILENINCLREVLNSEPGIEFIVRFKYDETAVQLAKVLSSENVAVKHQVYELLAALCAYSQEGYRLVHKCLKRYQETHKFDHTLHIVTSELKSCAGDDSKGPYRAVLLGFINCLIYFSDESRRKNLLRDLRNSLFFEILLSISAETGPDLSTQVAAFLRTLEEIGYEDILRLSAEVSLRKVYADISADRSRRLTKLLGKMADRDNEERFILLEKFESLTDANGDAVRSSDEATSPKTPTVVPVASTATSPMAFAFEPFTDSSTSPMSSPSTPAASVEKPSFPNGVAEASLTTSEIQRTASVPPPPPPPPGGKAGPPPPPPPPPGIPKAPPGPPGGGPPPPPPPGIHARSNTWSGADAAQKLPKENLKPVRWTKVFAPLEKLSHSIWRQTSKDEEVQIDTTKLKDLFVEKDLRRGSVGPIMIKTPSISHDLIDSKRSLKVNICLKKFKDVTVKNLVERIENLDVSFFEPDDLTGLMGILPTPEEVEIFKNFTGKLEDLDNAEAFFYWLVRIASFTLHVELLHFSKECPAQAEVLTKDFAELQMACDLVLGSETFKNFLHYALHVGNVLNSGRSIGEAVAIKLEGLLKLAETASNQPKVSLLHFVVQEIQKQSETAMGFVDTFGVLSKASGLQFDVLQSDCNALLARYDELGKRLDGASEMFQQRVHSCLKDPKTVVDRLKACRESLLASIKLVAEYFVEDPVQFKIEECFKSIHTFMKQITAVKKDFEKSEQEARRPPDTPLTGPRKPSVRHSGVSTLPRNFGGNRLADALADNGPPSDDLENRLLDQLTKAIRSGAPLRRVRMRS